MSSLRVRSLCGDPPPDLQPEAARKLVVNRTPAVLAQGKKGQSMSDDVKKLPSFIQVLVAQPIRKGISKKNGQPYEMQEADCVMLDEDGTLLQVGVMTVPREQMGKLEPGVYQPSFGISVNFQSRVITPVLMGLTAVRRAPSAAAPAAPASSAKATQ